MARSHNNYDRKGERSNFDGAGEPCFEKDQGWKQDGLCRLDGRR